MKYNNTKVTIDGIVYDSVKECKRHQELKLLERAGEIMNLQRQVVFELIPASKEPDTIGKRGGVKKGKVIENAVKYIADFTYIDNRTGYKIVEDSKGFRTKDYIIKRKLFKYFYKDYVFIET